MKIISYICCNILMILCHGGAQLSAIRNSITFRFKADAGKALQVVPLKIKYRHQAGYGQTAEFTKNTDSHDYSATINVGTLDDTRYFALFLKPADKKDANAFSINLGEAKSFIDKYGTDLTITSVTGESLKDVVIVTTPK